MPVDSFITVFIQCNVGLENKLIRAPLLGLAKFIYYIGLVIVTLVTSSFENKVNAHLQGFWHPGSSSIHEQPVLWFSFLDGIHVDQSFHHPLFGNNWGHYAHLVVEYFIC